MSKVIASESLVGKNVILEGGIKEKIVSVADNGTAYHMKKRRAQLHASRLVKIGRNLVEIARPSAKAIEDSEQGYAIITDPDLYYEIYDKPMRGHKAPKQPTPKKEEQEMSGKKSGSKKSGDKKSGSKKSKPVEIENLTDHDQEPAVAVQSAIQTAIEKTLTEKFVIEGAEDLAIDVKLNVFQNPDSEGVLCTGEFSIAAEYADAEDEVEISDETLAKVSKGLFEKTAFQNVLGKYDLSQIEIYSKVVDDEGDEFLVAGATKINKSGALVLQGEDGEPLVVKLSNFNSEYEIIEECEDDDGDDFLLDDEIELMDGDELEEAEETDLALTVNENALEECESKDEIVEHLLANHSIEVLVSFFKGNYEAETGAEKRALASGDIEAVANLIADTVFEGDESEEDESENEVEETFDDMDLSGAEDETEGEEIEDDSDWVVVDELADNVDDMIDALLEHEFITNKDVRKLDDEDIEQLYAANFKVEGEEETEEETEELDIDAMVDRLLEDDHVSHRELRKLDDDQIEALYEEHYGSEESEEEAEEEIEVDDMMDILIANGYPANQFRRMSDEEIMATYSDFKKGEDESEEDESEEDENDLPFELDDLGEFEEIDDEALDAELDEDELSDLG